MNEKAAQIIVANTLQTFTRSQDTVNVNAELTV